MVRARALGKDGCMSQLPVPRRRRDRSVVAGVCAAVAERWQVDPTLVRVAAVLLALALGLPELSD